MAKGNLFLGMGRGSIGDVTFYRGNGQQLSRVRNRKPYNPKTAAQMYQRAALATIVKAYQAGKAIFDHSFEGYRVGVANQRQFLSLNLKKLKQQIATDINTPLDVSDQVARVVAPKINTPVPNEYIISRGTYDQRLFNIQRGGWQMEPVVEYSEGNNETVASYADSNGLVAGDFYTLVAFVSRQDVAYELPLDDTSASTFATQYDCQFCWVRLKIKAGLLTNSNPLVTMDQLFDSEATESSPGFDIAPLQTMLNTKNPGAIIQWSDIFKETAGYLVNDGAVQGSFAFIRSRENEDLRSNTTMVLEYPYTHGIVSSFLLDVWASDAARVGNSDLILEGGDI